MVPKSRSYEEVAVNHRLPNTLMHHDAKIKDTVKLLQKKLNGSWRCPWKTILVFLAVAKTVSVNVLLRFSQLCDGARVSCSGVVLR